MLVPKLLEICQISVRNLSDICQKSVRKLSVAKICQMSVRYVSDNCQISVRSKIVSELYWKSFRNGSEMYQHLKKCQKTIRTTFRKLSEICQKYPFWHFSDSFLLRLGNISRKHSGQKTVRKLSNDTFLTHCYYLEGTEVIVLTYFWLISELQTDSILTQF